MKLLKICEPIRFSNALQVFENLLTLGKVMKVKVKNCKAHFTSTQESSNTAINVFKLT